MGKYAKLWTALAGAIVAGLYAYYGTGNELVQTAVAVLTALGVYAVPNRS